MVAKWVGDVIFLNDNNQSSILPFTHPDLFDNRYLEVLLLNHGRRTPCILALENHLSSTLLNPATVTANLLMKSLPHLQVHQVHWMKAKCQKYLGPHTKIMILWIAPRSIWPWEEGMLLVLSSHSFSSLSSFSSFSPFSPFTITAHILHFAWMIVFEEVIVVKVQLLVHLYWLPKRILFVIGWKCGHQKSDAHSHIRCVCVVRELNIMHEVISFVWRVLDHGHLFTCWFYDCQSKRSWISGWFVFYCNIILITQSQPHLIVLHDYWLGTLNI